MALAVWQRTIVDEAGNVIPGASVEIRSEATGNLAILKSDRAGATGMSNPATADADGFVQFFTAGGSYRIVASSGAFSREWRFVGIGTAQEIDAEDIHGFAGLNYARSTATASDASPGTVRGNSVDLAGATALYFAALDQHTNDQANRIVHFGDSSSEIRGSITLHQLSGGGEITFNVTGLSVDLREASPQLDVIEVPVAYTSGIDVFANGGSVSVEFSRTGDKGLATGVPDGDKVDLAVLGDTWTINPGVVTYAKIQDVSAQYRILGRASSGAGAIEEISTLPAQVMPAYSGGDATSSAGAVSLTIANDAVTYAKMQNVSVAARFLGRFTAGAGDVEELTGTQATSLLDAFTSTLKGLVPASGGGTTTFLRADGSFTVPSGGGDVGGPATNTDNFIPQWDGANTKVLKNGIDPATLALLVSPTFTGTPAAPTASPGTSTTQIATTAFVAAAPAGSGGGVRLVYTSATVLTLIPFNGNQIKIAGVLYSVPSAGVTLSNSGLADFTSYYVYAYNNAGTVTLETSATTHATDSTAGNIGVEIKSGDASRSLVGMIRTRSSNQFNDSVFQRFVASWFNRRPRGGSSHFTASRTTTSATYVELNTEIRLEWLTWADNDVVLGVAGSFYAAGLQFGQTSIGVDGTTPIDAYAGAFSSNTQAISLSCPVSVAEGYHYSTVLGNINNSGTGTWYVQANTAGNRFTNKVLTFI